MKNIFYLIALLPSAGLAQEFAFERSTINTAPYFIYETDHDKEVRIEHDIQSSAHYKIDKKGDTTLMSQFKFDEHGNTVYSHNKHWRADKYKINTISYDENSRLIGFTSTNWKEELVNRTEITRNARGKETDYKTFDKKEKLSFYRKTRYNDSLKDFTEMYYKGSDEPTYRYTYKFHPDGSKEEVKKYKKGKIKYTYHYDCNPNGLAEELQKKDTTTICVKEITDANGNLVKTTRSTNEKGKSTITEVTYNKEDEVVARKKWNEEDGKMIFEYQMSDTLDTYKRYYKKSSHVNSYHKNKDGDVCLKEFIGYRKGTLRYTRKSWLNEDGITSKEEYVHTKTKYSYTVEYEFDGPGFASKSTRKNSKGEVTRQYLHVHQTL